MKLTMEEFARLVGVSRATVSRVINNHPSVAEETKEKIRAAMEQYSFWPDGLARGLVTQRTGVVGMVTSGMVTPYHAAVIQAVEDELFERGYSVMFALPRDNVEREREYIRMLRSRRVDGLLVSPSRNKVGEVENAGLIRRLDSEGTPVVLIDKYIHDSRLDWIVFDLYGAARQAVEHLSGFGHNRIGYLCTGLQRDITDGKLLGDDRLEGYRDGLNEARIPFDENLVVSEDHSIIGGYRGLLKLLKVKPKPTAIFCYTDLLAVGALRAALASGLKVPEDISIIGCDDSDMAAVAEVPLTTLRLEKEELGRQAAGMLIDKIMTEDAENREPRQIVMPAELVVRESTAGKVQATVSRKED